mgnify:CR=1 FL=1
MRMLIGIGLLALAACGAPETETAETPMPAESGEPVPGWPDDAGPPERDPAETYRQRVTGRWSEAADCRGMSWNFQAESFTTPGEVHCARVDIPRGAGDAVRVSGSECTAEGEAQPDVVLDALVQGDRITVTGVGNPVDTPGWRRCQ